MYFCGRSSGMSDDDDGEYRCIMGASDISLLHQSDDVTCEVSVCVCLWTQRSG